MPRCSVGGDAMKPTVAIVGSHPRTREDFDFAREDCDIWLFNEAISGNNPWAKRADLVFQMHVPAIWRNPANRNDPHHYEWLKTQDQCDVMMQDVYEDVPRSKMYPLTDIARMLGTTAAELMNVDHFLSSSVPQAIALAILWGYKRIEVYGVAMETNTEYQFQREGVAFWIGFAKGHGVDLLFADPTFRAPLYGYEGKVSVEYAAFDERIDELKTHVPDIAAQHKAAVLDVRKALDLYLMDGSKDNENTLHACAEKIVQITSQLGALDGAIQENGRYKAKADKMREASGGEFVFSRQEFEAAAASLQKQANSEQVKYIGYGTQLGIKQDEISKAPKGSPKREKLGKEFWSIFGTYLQTVNRMNLYKGAANENMQYMQYLDKYIRAAGGEKSEAVLLESMRV
jgi:hypothetical protein